MWCPHFYDVTVLKIILYLVDFMKSRICIFLDRVKYWLAEPTDGFLNSLQFARFSIAHTDVQRPWAWGTSITYSRHKSWHCKGFVSMWNSVCDLTKFEEELGRCDAIDLRLPFQLQRPATAPWPVLVDRPAEGRRLSWPEWLVMYWDGKVVNPWTVTRLNASRAQRYSNFIVVISAVITAMHSRHLFAE